MPKILVTPPAIEPVSLAELKLHLRIADDQIDSVQSIAPGSHDIVSSYGLLGTAVDVLGYSAIVTVEAGACGIGGSVDIKLKESDDQVTWSDVPEGSFTQITEANDNANYEKAYSGGMRYLRPACTVAGAACIFGISIIKTGATTIEDTLLNSLIKVARRRIEYTMVNRALINQTWLYYLDKWPNWDYIALPMPPLSSVTSVKYLNASAVESTLTVTTQYLVDTKNEPGRIVLPEGADWPSTALYKLNPIYIQYVAGYGATAAAVPEEIRLAIMILAAHYYENRELVSVAPLKKVPMGVAALVASYRFIGF